jgi:Xaa-Pro aminopeptidase
MRAGFDSPLGENRIGHGIGLMSTEPPHVALYEEMLMEDGLVFTIEPRIVSDAGVFNCEELLLVTANGAKVLTSAARGLTVIN